MYSDKGLTLAAILEGFLSTCDEAQVLEAIQVLNDTISNLQNDNLTQEKAADSTEKKEQTEVKKRRAPNVTYDKELAKKVYNTARRYPNYTMEQLDEKLGLPKSTIRTARAKIIFMDEYRRLNNICKLGRLMSSVRDERRYQREIENYSDME